MSWNNNKNNGSALARAYIAASRPRAVYASVIAGGRAVAANSSAWAKAENSAGLRWT